MALRAACSVGWSNILCHHSSFSHNVLPVPWSSLLRALPKSCKHHDLSTIHFLENRVHAIHNYQTNDANNNRKKSNNCSGTGI